MYSKFNLRLLAAVMLAAALPLCALGAPLKDDPADPPLAETSGEEEEDPGACKILDEVLSVTESHESKFRDEFRGNAEYDSLDDYNHSFPDIDPHSNISKEDCFQRVAQGLLVYRALLKHVDREYHNNPIVNGVNGIIPGLIEQIKKMMRNASVVALNSSQEQQLLKEVDSPDQYHRKMAAHSILRSMHNLLVGGKRSFLKWKVCMPKD